MPIRLRLALSGVVVAGLALLVFVVLFDRLVVFGAPTEQDRQLGVVADRAVTDLADAEPDALDVGPAPVLVDPATSTDPFLAIVADGGAILYATADVTALLDALPRSAVERAAAEGAAGATVSPPGGTELRVQLRPWTRPDLGLSGVVIAGQPTRFAEEQVVGFRAVLVAAGLVALIAAAVATWFVSGRVLRPLRRLAETADEIGRTEDLSRRLPAVRSKDVTEALTNRFNGMLERLESARTRLAQTLEAQRRFVADASHELRGPLTSVRSNAGFLLERPDAGPQDRADAIGDIASESRRMSRLVDDLLTLARADAGQHLELVLVDVARVAEDAVRRLRREEHEVRLQLDGPAVVIGDADALSRLLRILVENATHHGAGDIEVGARTQGSRVVLEVADRGPGIAEADLDRIFERFFRADPSRSRGGAGLGLSIARWIAEAHGGSIRAANREGGGAVLVVELPSAVAVPVPAPPRPDPTA